MSVELTIFGLFMLALVLALLLDEGCVRLGRWIEPLKSSWDWRS